MNQIKPNEIIEPKVDVRKWMDDPLWYKDAIIYELHIKAFYDSDNNGTGDFPGLIQKLDYIQDLGVNTLWLLPFYPSPMRDDGYDIADYRDIHPEYGTMADFKLFVKEAHRRGLKIITELVINHTSDQHPWFQAARRAPVGSSKRDFYVWSDSNQKFPETRIIFQDAEKSNWCWDDEAHAYYWHRFFHHQPDLNFNNPKVVKAVIKLMRFWLDLGVDGMRLDAIPYLCVREGTQNENLPGTHAVIKQMRAILDTHYPHCVFLAEVNQWPEDVRDYFSDGDECHMAYHFPLMPRMYMAIAQEDRHPIVDIMQQTPNIPDSCQWAVFLRNHDELTLEMVTDKERDYMYEMYVLDPRARVNVGIRRRLAPLMDNEIDKIKLMNSLLLSMPGSPSLYYGDEIGMGDNIFLGDRNGVRTPMQWSPDRNAGFSRADPQCLYLPLIMDPIYGFGSVNVEAQQREQGSLLNWMQRVLALRKNHHAFGRGQLVFLHPRNRKILAYFRLYQDDIILCVANLSRAAQAFELDLSAYKGRVPVELMGRASFPPIGELPYILTLPGHNYYWFRLANGDEVPAWHDEHPLPVELPTLVLFDGWNSFFNDRVIPSRVAIAEKVRNQLEETILPNYIATQHWSCDKGNVLRRVVINDYAEWESEGKKWLMTLCRVEGDLSESYFCFLPLTLAWENGDAKQLHAMLPATAAKVRQQAEIGILAYAFADVSFCLALVQAIGSRVVLPCAIGGSIRFSPTDAFISLHNVATNQSIRALGIHGTNTTVVVAEQYFLKGYRQLEMGLNAEFEIGRFLSDVVKFPNIAPVFGIVEYEGSDGEKMSLAILQGYVGNQGDFWNYTLNYLGRFLEKYHTAVEQPKPAGQAHVAYLVLLRTLGQRTGELHKALGKVTSNPAFDPEPVTDADLSNWMQHGQAEAHRTLELLKSREAALPLSVLELAETLLAHRTGLTERLQINSFGQFKTVKARCHGDYHLGQVLLTQNDFVITDFKGDASCEFAERHRKHSPLRDVADMLRSFSYAAHTALAHACAEQPKDMEKFEPFIRDWEAEASRVFLEAYTEVVGSSVLTTDAPLLDLFILEKALYDVRNELVERPDWVVIPLRCILSRL